MSKFFTSDFPSVILKFATDRSNGIDDNMIPLRRILLSLSYPLFTTWKQVSRNNSYNRLLSTTLGAILFCSRIVHKWYMHLMIVRTCYGFVSIVYDRTEKSVLSRLFHAQLLYELCVVFQAQWLFDRSISRCNFTRCHFRFKFIFIKSLGNVWLNSGMNLRVDFLNTEI